MADIKAIKGTNGTTYSIVDRYSKWGGNNLAKNVFTSKAPSSYETCRTSLSENLIAGDTYTIQIWFTNSGRTAVCPYIGGGSYNVGAWQAITNNSTYCTWTFIATSQQAAASQYINIYASTTSGAQGSATLSGTFTVNKIKLEKGHKATDWSPCWEDIFTINDEELDVNI